MKNFKKLFSLISIILCIIILCASTASAQTTEAAAERFMTSADTFLTQIERLFSSKTTPNGIGDESHVFSLILIAPVRKEPNISSEVSEHLWIFTEVIIIDIKGSYYLVEKDGEPIGYMHSFWLAGGKAVTLKLSRDYDHVYVNDDNDNRIKTKYNGVDTITWSTDSPDIISVNSSTGKIMGIKPGLAKVTAKAGNKTDTAEIACINAWKEPETAKAEKSIEIKELPSSESDTIGTISAGTSIVAKGDLADGSGWIYVNAGGYWGFIKLDDFPGIDYLMTEYHYYDKGYNLRFGSASTKIYDYASVLNDVMTELFGLKICSYVEEYTSAADKCKIWRYGSVKSNNLASSCPKSGNHNLKSCLETTYIRDAMLADKGRGTSTTTKIIWTGHIMDEHLTDRSHSEITTQSIIVTTCNSVNDKTFKNKSDYEIRKSNIHAIVHETAHQLSAHDHYCYGRNTATGICDNDYCSICVKGQDPPFCTMSQVIDIETNAANKLFCTECKKDIEAHLTDHH